MRVHLRGLRLCHAVVHRPVEMVGNLSNLTGSDQSADCDETPIPWCVANAPLLSSKSIDVHSRLHTQRQCCQKHTILQSFEQDLSIVPRDD